MDLNSGEKVQWRHDKSTSVSGISGTPEATLGEVQLPLKIAGAKSKYSADVLGGEGSLCPALLSNPALRKQKAAILCDHFANGDGVMVIPDCQDVPEKTSSWHYLRLLLTDSGHYLLPVDDTRGVSNNTKEEVEARCEFGFKIYKVNGKTCDTASSWTRRHCMVGNVSGVTSLEQRQTRIHWRPPPLLPLSVLRPP